MNDLLSSRLYDNNNFYNAFEKDLKQAQHSILIESPFITTRRMNDLLPTLRKLRQRGVRIVVNTRNPDEHEMELATQAIQSIAILQDTGVMVLFTGRLHRKLAIIDREIIWEGSLNILSQNDSCEVMRRIKSAVLAWQMIRFVKIDQYC